jgi:YegS/Rv2252/BmrU family lipid kinase
MKKIRFIANPHSGANRKRNLSQLIEANLDHSQFEHEVCFTEYAGHAIKLAKEGVEKHFDIVVACGGDGSVNEISSQLIGTETVLGILPCGSGNGFAMHLGIGRHIAKAIQFLNNGKVITIDSCRMNERIFVNLAGIGFDAVVARRLHRKKVRGIWGYLINTLREVYNYDMQNLEIQIDGKTMHRTCFLVEVANAPVYGYGFSIVPQAKPYDGKLEILIAKNASKWRYILACWRFLNHSFHLSPLVECFTGKEVVITSTRPTAIHVDGEGFKFSGKAHFTIQPQSLKVMCPKPYAET